MKTATRLMATCAAMAGAAAAFAHEGHGLDGAHWHATDAGIFVIVLAVVGVALWLGGRK